MVSLPQRGDYDKLLRTCSKVNHEIQNLYSNKPKNDSVVKSSISFKFKKSKVHAMIYIDGLNNKMEKSKASIY